MSSPGPSTGRQRYTAAEIIFSFLLISSTFAFLLFGWSSYDSQQIMDYSHSVLDQFVIPATYQAAHPRDFRIQREKRQNRTARPLPVYYSSLIAFGDSYSGTSSSHSQVDSF